MTIDVTTGQTTPLTHGVNAESGSYLYVGEALKNKAVLEQVEALLCYKGGCIYTANSATEARVVLENSAIKAVLIDQYLDQGSGIEFMRWMHSVVAVPAIIVVINTASMSIETIVALEAGATDAVHADIAPRELAARIHACTRKYFHTPFELGENQQQAAPRGATTRECGPLYFSPHNHNLYYSDTSKIVLSSKEADLLELLVRKYPGYVTREEISLEIYHRSWNPNDRNVDNLVSRLRKSIATKQGEVGDSIIETLRNEGYRLRSAIGLLPAEHKLNAIEKARLEQLLKRSGE